MIRKHITTSCFSSLAKAQPYSFPWHARAKQEASLWDYSRQHEKQCIWYEWRCAISLCLGTYQLDTFAKRTGIRYWVLLVLQWSPENHRHHLEKSSSQKILDYFGLSSRVSLRQCISWIRWRLLLNAISVNGKKRDKTSTFCLWLKTNFVNSGWFSGQFDNPIPY